MGDLEQRWQIIVTELCDKTYQAHYQILGQGITGRKNIKFALTAEPGQSMDNLVTKAKQMARMFKIARVINLDQ